MGGIHPPDSAHCWARACWVQRTEDAHHCQCDGSEGRNLRSILWPRPCTCASRSIGSGGPVIVAIGTFPSCDRGRRRICKDQPKFYLGQLQPRPKDLVWYGTKDSGQQLGHNHSSRYLIHPRPRLFLPARALYPGQQQARHRRAGTGRGIKQLYHHHVKVLSRIRSTVSHHHRSPSKLDQLRPRQEHCQWESARPGGRNGRETHGQCFICRHSRK